MPQASPRPFAIPFLLVAALLAAPSASAWEYTASGGDNAFEEALAVALNHNDHVVAAGSIGGFRFFVAKVNRKHGHEIWRFELPASNPAQARAVAIGPDGHAVAAGRAAGNFTVVKLDQEDGTPYWVAHIPGGDAFAVGVDAAGDVVAAGTGPSGMFAVKLDGSDGAELWRAEPVGAAPGGQVRALALDAEGNAAVAGFTVTAGSRASFTVVELDGDDGSERWRHAIEPHPFAGINEAIAVAVDPYGDVVATGSVQVSLMDNALPIEFRVVKLWGDDGSVAWQRDLSPGPPSDSGRALAVDAAGDVIAAGSIADEAGSHPAVMKLSGADGTDLWRNLEDGRAADAVAVDGAGDVIATGTGRVDGGFDILLRKLAGATGTEIWHAQIDGPGSGEDRGRAVVVDSKNDVVVAGRLHGGASGPDFAILKRSGENGADF